MKQKARSFKKQLILSFLTIGLASIILLGSFQIFQLSSLIKENQNNQIMLTTFLEDYIGNYVEQHERIIETMSQNISNLFAEGDYNTIKQKLMEIKSNYPGFVNLYVGDKNGQSLLFYPDVYTDGKKRENLNFSDRLYYQKVVDTEETVISPVFHGRGGTDLLLVAIVSPIFDNEGRMQGYILGGLDLNELDKYISKRKLGKESTAVVFDQQDNVIVHPDIDSRKEIVNLSDSPIVQRIKKHNGSGSLTLGVGDETEYITFATIKGLDWTIWVANPLTAITGTFKKAIITIAVFALITGAIVVIASILLTNRLEHAILRLLRYIKQYTRGYKNNQSVELTETIHGPSEMNELLIHFNDMMQEIDANRTELLELNTKLEARVQERTANLQHKNMELRAVNKLITSVSAEKDLAHFIQYCLKNIGQYTDYHIHILFQDLAITSSSILTKRDYNEYLSMKTHHVEPISFDTDLKGFLVIELQDGQMIKPEDREFLQTFSRSLAIMLENKLLFERFRDKHAELEAVLESMFEGIMLLNNSNQIKYVNEYFRQVISDNLDLEKVLPLQTLDDVFARIVEYFEVDQEELATFFANDDGVELKLAFNKSNGKVNYYLLHKFSVKTDEDHIGSGLLIRDITKEEEIDTLKNNLISLTSHEFKTPITNIKGSVETLLRKDVEWDPEFQFELLEGIHEDIERILHLVNDWMDISKIESGTMYIERNMIRADHVIEESLAMVPKTLQERATFKFHHKAEEYLFIYADKSRVQQVLLNLFTNALRYNDSAHKRVDVTLRKIPGYITISVSDNGIGISREHVEKIFNRFYQVDVTATRRSGGTGLGLSICEGIMEAHGGKIDVESIPGKGSTFILYFPIREDAT